MKIACIAYLHGFGGAERQLITLANQMVSRGHEVHMILLSDNKICYEIDYRIKIHSLLNAERGNPIGKIFRRRRALIKKLKELHCDVVVNFNFQSAYLLAFEDKNKIGKIIYCERGDPGDKEYKGFMGLIRYFVLPHIDGYVFQSEGARDFFNCRHVLNNCSVIPNACFKKYEPFNGVRRKVIVTVGRLSHQKNQTLLIKAFAKCAKRIPDYNLEIIGDGELKNELQELINNLGLQDRICLKGTFKNVDDLIRDVSLFVLSSDYEGIPNALIEAMSLGLPCISTDCKPGGARTIITNGVDGIITPWRDEEKLADAILNMILNPLEANRIGKSAMNISERLSPQIIYDSWESTLNNFLKHEY